MFGKFGRKLREVYPRRVLIGIVIIGLLGGLLMWGAEIVLPRVLCAVAVCHEPQPTQSPGDVIMDGVGPAR